MNQQIHCPKCGAFAKLKMHRRNALGTYDHTVFYCAGQRIVNKVDGKTGQILHRMPIHVGFNFIRQLKGIVL